MNPKEETVVVLNLCSSSGVANERSNTLYEVLHPSLVFIFYFLFAHTHIFLIDIMNSTDAAILCC